MMRDQLKMTEICPRGEWGLDSFGPWLCREGVAVEAESQCHRDVNLREQHAEVWLTTRAEEALSDLLVLKSAYLLKPTRLPASRQSDTHGLGIYMSSAAGTRADMVLDARVDHSRDISRTVLSGPNTRGWRMWRNWPANGWRDRA